MPTRIPSVWRWDFSVGKRSPKAMLLGQKAKASPVSLYCLSLSLKKDKVVWFNMPDSQISVWDYPDNSACAGPLMHRSHLLRDPQRVPQRSQIPSASNFQAERLSPGKPEHMVALCLCANSIQPWMLSSCAGKWRQVPGKQSREQPSGRWGWQDCPGCDLLRLLLFPCGKREELCCSRSPPRITPDWHTVYLVWSAWVTVAPLAGLDSTAHVVPLTW